MIQYHHMSLYFRTLLILLVMHVLAMSMYVHRVPGLLGDEGSEGENVYTILDTKQLTVYGERSYIGPLLDYIRIPFVLAFGYNALALRVPIIIFSVLTLLLCASVARRIFGEQAALYVVAAIFFSPIYLLYQRLGWAITLIPFFAILTTWLLLGHGPLKFLWAGFAAGLALHSHFVFLPTLVAIVVISLLLQLWRLRPLRSQQTGLPANVLSSPPGDGTKAGPVARRYVQQVFSFAIGFLAAFGTQLAVLLTARDDQGEPAHVIKLFAERLQQLPEVLPKLVSGSVFSAFYTGEAWPASTIVSVTVLLAALVGCALVISPRKRVAGWWVAAIIIHTLGLLLIIDRYAARYAVTLALAVWGLAGYGLYSLLAKVASRWLALGYVLPVVVALLLTSALSAPALWHFLVTGGSTASVHLAPQRSEPAAAFVDIRPLLRCVAKQGVVFSESVHIYNRLRYLSHDQPQLQVTNQADRASLVVEYRERGAAATEPEVCPELQHFKVRLALGNPLVIPQLPRQ